VKTLGWNLADIDRTDIESMMLFVIRFTNGGAPTQVYCDQANWL